MNTIDPIFEYLTMNKKGYDKLETMNQISLQLFTLFMGISIHRYKWNGLPEELSSYNLEKILNYRGQGVLVKNNNRYLFLTLANQASLNIYGEPIMVNAIGLNGQQFGNFYIKPSYDFENMQGIEQNAVWLRNNDTCTSTYFLLKPIIDRLCFIWESLGINEGLSRIKAIIHANKNVAGTIKNEVKRVIGSGTPFAVVMEKSNILDEIEKVDFNVDYEPQEYWADFDKTFNLACQLVGITTNMASQKKERLITNEVESNDELTTLCEDNFLDHRKEFCKEVKRVFGLTLSVENKNADVKTKGKDDKNPLSTKKDTPTP